MLEDKDFREDLKQGGNKSQAEQSETVTDPALIPGYRTEDRPTTTDLPVERSLVIESILADIRKKVDGDVRIPADAAQTPLADASPSDETAIGESPADAPSADGLPVAQSDDREVMRQLVLSVQELTEEVKQLRSQIETRPYDPAHYPSERPPGSALDAEDGSSSETQPNAQSDQKKPAKKNKVLSVISSVLFYVVIVAMVLGAFLMRSASDGKPFMLAGFSAANVLTSSMEDVYPKGSLIIIKQGDADELQIGDDITFMVSEDSSITHRIIEITEDYQGTGERAFKTQGTMNAKPDKEMVAAANVVGKVIFHSKALGDFANFVKANWPILIFVLIVIIVLISFLKWNAKRTDDEEKKLSEKTPSPKKGTHTKRRLRKSEEEVE